MNKGEILWLMFLAAIEDMVLIIDIGKESQSLINYKQFTFKKKLLHCLPMQ